MIKEFGKVFKFAFKDDIFISSFTKALFPKNWEKQIAENLQKIVELNKQKTNTLKEISEKIKV